MDFAASTKSDHLMLANVITDFYHADNKSRFCWNNFISESVIKMLVNMKSQLAQNLYAKRFLESDDYMAESANRNSNNESLVRAIICAGLYPNVAKVKKVKKSEHQNTLLFSTYDKRIQFHPKSVLYSAKKFLYPWVVYHMKQKSTQTYLFDATIVSPLSLLFFGKEVKTGEDHLENGERLETVSADNFITFNCEARTARFVSHARSALDTVIEDKVSNPSPTTWSSKHGRILGIIAEPLDTELEGIETDY